MKSPCLSCVNKDSDKAKCLEGCEEIKKFQKDLGKETRFRTNSSMATSNCYVCDTKGIPMYVFGGRRVVNK